MRQYINDRVSLTPQSRIMIVRRIITRTYVVGVDTTYMIMYHVRLEKELHARVWPINRVLTKTF